MFVVSRFFCWRRTGWPARKQCSSFSLTPSLSLLFFFFFLLVSANSASLVVARASPALVYPTTRTSVRPSFNLTLCLTEFADKTPIMPPRLLLPLPLPLLLLLLLVRLSRPIGAGRAPIATWNARFP